MWSCPCGIFVPICKVWAHFPGPGVSHVSLWYTFVEIYFVFVFPQQSKCEWDRATSNCSGRLYSLHLQVSCPALPEHQPTCRYRWRWRWEDSCGLSEPRCGKKKVRTAAITQDLVPSCDAEHRPIKSWECKETQLGFRAAQVEAWPPSLLPFQIIPYQVLLLTLGRLLCPGGRAHRLLLWNRCTQPVK